ncbi:TlpA disulfide reductase family protein [Chitinophaga eiseniae]|uniref:AhpC/TSA family protein n=1 Tax=Chitinophaga eiseniae TaxID=634771 RepID=A0A847SLD1_9BACT|nr:TlpA disulfide reductase family protein [Chitinophaga eiseniae]NLR78408.1 AhpC/TSA family protein [Chitinophaga eiseniae]
MLKKILMQGVVMLLSAVSVFGQFAGPFQINGSTVNIADVDKVVLRYRSADGLQSDTIKVVDGRYSFFGQIVEPQLVWVNMLHTPNEYGRVKYPKKDEVYQMYLNSGVVEVQSADNFANMHATGTGAKWQKDYAYLAQQQQLTKDSGETMVITYREASLRMKGGLVPNYTAADRQKDSIKVKEIDDKYLTLTEHLNKNILLPYIKNSPGSPLALWALKIYTGERVNDYQEAKALFESLSDNVRNMPIAKPYTQLLQAVSISSEGVIAPEFSLPDTSNTMVTLESLRGKYVLLDFWASWCGPCRAENPHVRKLYQQYKDKGFTVLSVSIDNKSQLKAWKKAIEEDGLTWTQVVTTDGNVARLYNVNSVPQNFLINPEGKIIAKNLERQALSDKLKTLFAH